jgi:IS30 family transposase
VAMSPYTKAVRKWANAARFATASRDAAIRAMKAEGSSYREIAEAAGLSHGAIQKIVARGNGSTTTATAIRADARRAVDEAMANGTLPAETPTEVLAHIARAIRPVVQAQSIEAGNGARS